MFVTIPDYEISEMLLETDETWVFRAFREMDQLPVVLKVLKTKHPSFQEINRIKQEFELLKSLSSIEQIPKALNLEEHDNQFILVLSAISGIQLSSYMASKTIPISHFLTLAIKLADMIGLVHHQDVILQNVCPENIMYDETKNEVKLLDFCHASKNAEPGKIQGTFKKLTYISPEQTGRMSRTIDYKTDIYSLGVVLYELLVGFPPFYSKDTMEMIHFHLAKVPISPHELNLSIPPIVSNIVMKCLSKSSEERYHSAFGLKNDLEECQFQLNENKIIRDFRPGENDIYDRFQISLRLYGREKDLHQLLHAFDRISYGKAELTLISGYAGVGKTSLVQQAKKLIVKQCSYFITGKFDQLRRGIPYGAWLEAFKQLIHQILTKKENEIAEIKDKILNALQDNTQVLIDLIPDLKILLGKQKPPPALPAIESQNRLRLLLNKFIRTIGDRDHSLVIFLDDLQWADPASLQLVQSLMTDASLRHVFLIGAYRDQEVFEAHPLIQMMEIIKKEKGNLNEIALTPLSAEHVTQLVADTLHSSLERSKDLSALLYEKTQGNPFFLIQNLKNLHKQGELVFDLNYYQWKWDLKRIQRMEQSENVIDFLVKYIQELPPAIQAVLAIAAAIGSKVNAQSLAKVSCLSIEATENSLKQAFKDELIKKVDEDDNFYEFVHDRIQQAAYSILSEEDKEQIHWDIGRYLLEEYRVTGEEDRIFEVVSHLNKAQFLLSTPEDRLLLMELNLRACRKAKSSAAYLTAFLTINTAKDLLSSDSWETKYDLTYAIYLESAECAYLVKRFDLIDQISDTILKCAKTNIEKGQLYILKIDAYTNLAQAQKALDEGFECLRLFNIEMHMHPTIFNILRHWLCVKWKMRNVNIADLENLPQIPDKEKQFVMDVMIHMTTAAFLLDKPLMCYITMLLMSETLTYGNCEDAFYVYLAYGTFLEIAFRQYNKAYEFAMLGVRLVAKQNSPSAKCRINYVTSVLINHWVNPLRTNEPYMNDCQTYGIESGELTYISFMGAFFGYLDGAYHRSLQEAFKRISHYETLIFSCQNRQAVHVYLIKKQIVKKMVKRGFDGLSLTDDEFDEEAFVERVTSEKELMPSYQAYAAYKSFVSYLFGHYKEALFVIEDSLPNREKCVTLITERDLNIYHSLTLAALYQQASRFQRWKYRRCIRKNLKVLKLWTECCPENNAHRYELVLAEVARIENKFESALKYYDEAIRLAKQNESTVDEALGNELAGRLLLQLDKSVMAHAYLSEAHYAYYRWGAEAKVYLLEQEFPFLAMVMDKPQSSKETGEAGSKDLDLRAVMRASAILSGEIRLDNLIEQLMKIIIENAGADKAIFLMEKQGKWFIQGARYLMDEQAEVHQNIPLEKEMRELSSTIVNYVIRSKEDIVLNDAVHVGLFSQDPYIIKYKPKSVLCMPLLHQGRLTAVLYLENNATTDAFTPQNIKILRLLSSHIASATINATLYSDIEIASENLIHLNEKLENYSKDLEVKVTERTQELIEKNNELADTLQSLTEMQKQVIQQEKLAALGALTQGVAHEIKNPLNFIDNFSTLSIEILADFVQSIHKDPIEAESLLNYLKQNLQKINEHSKRADGIVMSMLEHSKHSQGSKELVDVNDLLKKYVLLMLRTAQQKYPDMEIEVETNYDFSIEQTHLIAQDIGRCFMNILDNACYSLNEKSILLKNEFTPQISVSTKKLQDMIEIRLRDNGVGISHSDMEKIFVPFFTTKPTGTGTGLGLSIAYDIIVKEHEGHFSCISEPGSYCEFVIQLPFAPHLSKRNLTVVRTS